MNTSAKKIYSASTGTYIRVVTPADMDEDSTEDTPPAPAPANHEGTGQGRPPELGRSVDPPVFVQQLPPNVYDGPVSQYEEEFVDVYRKGHSARFLFILVLLLNLSALVFFKYTNFLGEVLNPLFTRLHVGFTLPTLSLLLPLGISFYTFQSIGYMIDVYRGKIKPEKNPIDYALFMCFFPHILSGPIARFSQLMPQIKSKRRLNYQNLLFGAQRFAWGLFKKTVISDWFLMVSSELYARMYTQTGLPVIVAAILYGLYVYMDFSAYCDMALGAARMLGFTLIENFGAPYFAINFSSYWKRWHISLTTWLTDYIFTPLVWSRWWNKLFFGKHWEDHAPHFAANIVIIFLISGIWHGAGYAFLIWGALHGIYRLLEELLHKIRKPGQIKNKALLWLINPFKRLVVFALATIAHVFFAVGNGSIAPPEGAARSSNLSDAAYAFKAMIGPFDFSALLDSLTSIFRTYVTSDARYIQYHMAVIAGACLLVMLLDYLVIYRATKKRVNPGNVLQHVPFLLRWPIYLFMVAAIILVGYFGNSPFIYYNF